MVSKRRLKQEINILSQQKAELEQLNIIKEQEINFLINDVKALQAENFNNRMVIDNLTNKLNSTQSNNSMMLLMMILLGKFSQQNGPQQQNIPYGFVNPFVQNNVGFFPGQLNIGAASPFAFNNNFTNIANNNFLAPVNYQNQFNMPVTNFAPIPLAI